MFSFLLVQFTGRRLRENWGGAGMALPTPTTILLLVSRSSDQSTKQLHQLPTSSTNNSVHKRSSQRIHHQKYPVTDAKDYIAVAKSTYWIYYHFSCLHKILAWPGPRTDISVRCFSSDSTQERSTCGLGWGMIRHWCDIECKFRLIAQSGLFGMMILQCSTQYWSHLTQLVHSSVASMAWFMCFVLTRYSWGWDYILIVSYRHEEDQWEL